jgi:diacylglycerol kinase
MKSKFFLFLCVSLLLLTVVSARVEIVRPEAGVLWTTWTGNLTNVSEMEDVNVPTPTEGYVFTWNSTTGVWEAQAPGAANNASVNNYILENNNSVQNTIQTDNSSVNNYILYVNSTNPGGITTEADPMWTANWTSYVPYSSATQNVDLGNWNITADWGNFEHMNVTEAIHLLSDRELYFGDNDDSIFYQSLSGDFHFAGTGFTYLTTTEGIFNFTGCNIDMFEGNVTAGYFFGNGSQLTDIISTDTTWVANWTDYNTSWSSDTWVANFSSYYTSAEVDAINTSVENTIQTDNSSVNNYILYVNSTNFQVDTDTWVANYTYYYNKTQIDDNNASVENTIQTDNSSVNNYILYVNSTNFQVDTDTWVANFSSYYTSTEVDAINTSVENTIQTDNSSVNNYILYVNSTNFQVDTDTWVANFSSYYTSTEVDAINSSVENTIQTDNSSMNNYIINHSVPYTGATANINISFNNLSIGGGTIWWNGTYLIFT